MADIKLEKELANAVISNEKPEEIKEYCPHLYVAFFNKSERKGMELLPRLYCKKTNYYCVGMDRFINDEALSCDVGEIKPELFSRCPSNDNRKELMKIIFDIEGEKNKIK